MNAKTKSTPDEYGNYFETELMKGWLVVSLKLDKEVKSRAIGKIQLNDRYIELKRDRSKHLFRKNNSYGFNEYLIRASKTFDNVKLIDDTGTYVFPKTTILEKGSYLFFKQQGFEKQLFLQLDEIEKFKVNNIQF
jgi:hypothetical protein